MKVRDANTHAQYATIRKVIQEKKENLLDAEKALYSQCPKLELISLVLTINIWGEE
jgi:hypothetical protein